MKNEFATKVLDAISRYSLVESGDRVLVAVSGGADSIALLRVLHYLSPQLDIELFVAHLNHCIRGNESDGDEEFVRSLAEKLEIRYAMERVDIPEIMQRLGGSMEEIARRERYAFLQRTALQLDVSKIAIGHTKDDNVETVLQRILRGTGIRGLGGIPPMRPIAGGSNVFIVRPIIDISREELIEFLASIGQDYRTDSSNENIAYFRNRLRHVVLPFMESECMGARESLNRLAHAARDQYNLIESLARELLHNAKVHGEPQALYRSVLREANPELAIEALRLACENFGAAQLTYEQSRGLLGLLAADTGVEMSLPGGLTLRAEYDILRVMPEGFGKPAAETVLPVPGNVEFLKKEFIAELIDNQPGLLKQFIREKNRNQELLDFDRLNIPLTLRTRRPGDRFHPLGAPGVRKLHDFLIDEKLPAWRRDRLPLVCDSSGIIWVAGHRIDQRVRVTQNTKRLLRLEMTNMR